MPRAPRARIGRRTANATRMYNRRQQDNTPHINANNMGQQVILPSSFTGSPRYMHEKIRMP